MTKTCLACGVTYDDAVASTICPHQRFLSDKEGVRKDRALAMLGKNVRWAHDVNRNLGLIRVTSVNAIGMVTITDNPGFFSPDLFVVVGEAHS